MLGSMHLSFSLTLRAVCCADPCPMHNSPMSQLSALQGPLHVAVACYEQAVCHEHCAQLGATPNSAKVLRLACALLLRLSSTCRPCAPCVPMQPEEPKDAGAAANGNSVAGDLGKLKLNPTASTFPPPANGTAANGTAAAPEAPRPRPVAPVLTAYGDHTAVVGSLMDRLCAGGADAESAAVEIALMVLGAGVTQVHARMHALYACVVVFMLGSLCSCARGRVCLWCCALTGAAPWVVLCMLPASCHAWRLCTRHATAAGRASCRQLQNVACLRPCAHVTPSPCNFSCPHHITPPLPQGMEGYGFATQLRAALEDGGNAGAREGALLAYRALAENVGRAAEPYIVPLLNSVLERLADKAAPVSGSFLCVSCLFRTDMRGVSVLVWVAAPVRPCAGWPCSLLIVVCDWARLGLAYWGRMGGVLGFVDSLCLGGHGVCHG